MKALHPWLAGVLFALNALSAIAQETPADRQEIQIVLSNYRFAPNMWRFQRNATYTLHLMNSASGGHAFSAPALFAAVAVAPEDRAKITNGRIEVAAGQTVDITFMPMTAGTYPVTCTHILHSAFGMRGQAVIE